MCMKEPYIVQRTSSSPTTIPIMPCSATDDAEPCSDANVRQKSPVTATVTKRTALCLFRFGNGRAE